jgi:hypothetical protein
VLTTPAICTARRLGRMASALCTYTEGPFAITCTERVTQQREGRKALFSLGCVYRVAMTRDRLLPQRVPFASRYCSVIQLSTEWWRIVDAGFKVLGQTNFCHVRFEVFTAVTTKNTVFWDIKTQFVLHRRHITAPLHNPVG